MTRETKRKPLEMARTFTADLVMKSIKRCRNSKAFGLNMLSIFHLGISDLGRFNTSQPSSTSRSQPFRFRLYGIHISHPNTEAWQGHLPRNFLPANLVTLPSRKSPGISAFTHNQQMSPAQDQHGFRREHSTTSVLL